MVASKSANRLRGLATPSRKFSVYHEDIEAGAKDRKFDEDGGKGMPGYFPVPSSDSVSKSIGD